MDKFFVSCFLLVIVCASGTEDSTVNGAEEYKWDPKGYIIFCLCMGNNFNF